MVHSLSLIRPLGGALLAAILTIFSVGMVAGQAVDDSPIAAFILAKDDGEGFAGEAATSFMTTDVPIHCVIELKSTDDATVRMNFVAVSVSGVKSGSRIVTASYTTKNGENLVKFHGRPTGSWAAGTYRVDIFIKEKLAASQEFPILQRPVPAAQMKFVAGKPKLGSSASKPKPRPRKN